MSDERPASSEARKLSKIRHSLAHVMASAVKELFPHVRFGIGPVIDDGFYYDFDLSPTKSSGALINHKISDRDFREIEKKMKKIISTGIPIKKELVKVEDAIKNEKVHGQKYKVELLEEIKKGERTVEDVDVKAGKVTYYTIDKFSDLCKGPHVKNTKELPLEGFKLIRTAGAYWRGDEKREQLQRIYAVAFNNKKELDDYLKLLEEAKKRDHKKLGKELDLFTFSDLIGAGLPLFTPKGTIIRNELDNFVWKLRKEKSYEMVDIPHLTKKDLYEKSGHWAKFKDELFKMETREGHIFAMKPMNCPHHTQIYARKQHSYKELPVRYSSTTKVYRDEQSGELAGLSRVRAITQDDAHVFCRKSQIEDEIKNIWEIVDNFYKTAGFDMQVRLSLHDPKNMKAYIGTAKEWKEAESILRKVAKGKKVKFTEEVGEAAFYGPKIDFVAKDSLEREWQVATIQLDPNMPENFDLTCINEKGEKEKIFMLHCAIMGSIERYLSILIEHFGGAFPVWLSPVQVNIVPISDKHLDYARKVSEELKENNIRVEVNDSNDTIGKRIREAGLKKIPYTLVVGDKEEKDKKVAVRKRGSKDIKTESLKNFLKVITKDIETKKLP